MENKVSKTENCFFILSKELHLRARDLQYTVEMNIVPLMYLSMYH